MGSEKGFHQTLGIEEPIMRARFQVLSKERDAPPFLVIYFSDDVMLPSAVYITGDIRTHGLIISSFKRSGGQTVIVPSTGPKNWSKHVILPWAFIGGYSDPSHIKPTNILEIPVLPNDPIRAERWMIEPLMMKTNHQKLILKPEPQLAVQVKPETIKIDNEPVFTKLRKAVRNLNEVLAELPIEPNIRVDGRKIKVSIALD